MRFFILVGLLFMVFGSCNSSCGTGYTADSSGNCVDVDECLNVNCGGFGSCINTNGSYRCDCDENFKSINNGTDCEDIDECSDSTLSVCSEFGDCTNSIGSHSCSCKTGYTGNGTFCEEIDECDSNPCDNNATCTDMLNSYSCACNSGFTGNGTVCTILSDTEATTTHQNDNTTPPDISGTTCIGTSCNDNSTLQENNRCQSNPCGPNATCTNTADSYTCTCNEGFSGNGTVCVTLSDDVTKNIRVSCLGGILCNSSSSLKGSLLYIWATISAIALHTLVDRSFA